MPGILILSLVLILDQASKAAVLRFFAPGESRPVLGGFFSLTHHSNTGAAFGLFADSPGVLLALSAVFSAAVAIYLFRSARLPGGQARRGGSPFRVPLVLILGGALGNTIDRIRFGRVIDFIDVGFWPVFNAADSAITIGAACIAWRLWQARRGGQGRRRQKPERSHGAA